MIYHLDSRWVLRELARDLAIRAAIGGATLLLSAAGRLVGAR